MSDFEKSINASDLIDWIMCAFPDWCVGDVREIVDHIEDMPSAQPELLTDKEQRIFLAAMGREEKVCKQVDKEWRDCREPYEDSLVRVCHEITRKVKAALSAQPVIRCKDCKNHGGGTYCHEKDGIWNENDFCSYAERKEQDDG